MAELCEDGQNARGLSIPRPEVSCSGSVALTRGGGKISPQFRDWALAFHRDCKSRTRPVRLDSHNLTLADDLGGANDVVSQNSHDEFYVTMLRNRTISFQENTADTYVLADGSKLRNRVSEIKLHADRVAKTESTILAYFRTRLSARISPFRHKSFFGEFSIDRYTIRDLRQVRKSTPPARKFGQTSDSDWIDSYAVTGDAAPLFPLKIG